MASPRKSDKEFGTFPIGRCAGCNKDSFTSRKGAKIAGRRRHGRSGHLNAYQCPSNEDMWHLGNLPVMNRRGDATRAELRPRRV